MGPLQTFAVVEDVVGIDDWWCCYCCYDCTVLHPHWENALQCEYRGNGLPRYARYDHYGDCPPTVTQGLIAGGRKGKLLDVIELDASTRLPALAAAADYCSGCYEVFGYES